MKVLLKEEMKKILGGYVAPDTCNWYCGKGSNQKCDTESGPHKCPYCVDAGNGKGSGPGEDKLCSTNP